MITDAQQKLFEKLNDHVLMMSISLTQFWNTNRLCISLAQFEEFLEKVHFPLDAVEEVKEEGLEFITLQNLIEGVFEWKKAQKSISEFLAHKNPTKKQTLSQSNSEVGYRSGVKSFYTTKKTKTDFLKEHLKKQRSEKSKLYRTMITAKNENDYEITMKVGELNDICKKLKNGIHYIINTKVPEENMQNGILQIIESTKGTNQQVIPIKVFDRKYEAYKQASINEVQEFEGTLEDDLKKVFVEVMCLSSELESQIKLLQRKGISH